jgi:hypothetical protein
VLCKHIIGWLLKRVLRIRQPTKNDAAQGLQSIRVEPTHSYHITRSNNRNSHNIVSTASLDVLQKRRQCWILVVASGNLKVSMLLVESDEIVKLSPPPVSPWIPL